jgi:hypothetical protein
MNRSLRFAVSEQGESPMRLTDVRKWNHHAWTQLYEAALFEREVVRTHLERAACYSSKRARNSAPDAGPGERNSRPEESPECFEGTGAAFRIRRADGKGNRVRQVSLVTYD